MSGLRAASRPRTLAEALRGREPAALAELIRLRPDLGYPRPADLADLATRAATPTSVARALEPLDAWSRLVAEALAALPDPATAVDVSRLLGTSEADVARAVRLLEDRALLWGDDDLHLVRGAREAFGPHPGGLAPPSPHPLTDAEIEARLAACEPSVTAVLDRLTWSPVGAVRHAERTVQPAQARTPVEQLLARRLLRPAGPDSVVLPREVAWYLRGGRFSADPVSPRPPELTGRVRSAGLVDRAAAGAAYELLDDVDRVGQLLETTQHRLLRSGGLAVRDTAALARGLQADRARAVFTVECAAAAGLVSAGGGGTLLPTSAYDRWAATDAPTRWQTLAEAWLRSGRHLSGSARPGAHPLGAEAVQGAMPGLREVLLATLRDLAPGTQPGPEALAAAVRWRAPRLAERSGDLGATVAELLVEAGWLGLTGLGATAGFLGALTDGGELPGALAELFPAPVDRLVIQADLTAVAPGPLPHDLSRELRLLADQESRGSGAVYRFSGPSLRRALDAGWAPGDVLRWLEQHSATPVPQALTYLVGDAGRRHGSIRVGTAAAYLRVADPTQVPALVAHPEAPGLGLRDLGGGVVVSGAEVEDVIDFLRRIGHSPAAEDEHGAVLATPSNPRATATAGVWRAPAVDPVAVAEAMLRTEAGPPEAGVEATLAALRTATQRAEPVRVSWVGPDGSRRARVLSPLDLLDGTLRAVDEAAAEVKLIPLARVLSVGPAGSAT